MLYASFDEVPAPKGAAIHIEQFGAAIAEFAELTLVTVRSAREDREWPAGDHGPFRHLEFGVPDANFLDRVMHFRRKLAVLLRGEGFDIIHFRSIWEGAVAAALGNRAGLIYEVNALPSIELKYLYPAVARSRPLLLKLRDQELSLMVQADRIVTPSAVTAQFLSRQGIRSERIRVVPNGVDTDLFSPPAEEPPTPPVELLYTGTLAPWQGLELLYRGMKGVETVRLRVIGASRKQWVRRHRRLVAKLGLEGRVEFCEPLSQPALAAAMRSAHICVAPLRASDRNVVQGCCPLKLLEYAASGRAILAADLPVVRGVFESSGNAMLYNPRKVSHLKRALEELAADSVLRRRLGEAARARVVAGFTWEAARIRLSECYREILS